MIGSIFGKGHAQNEPGTFGIRNQRSYQKLIGHLWVNLSNKMSNDCNTLKYIKYINSP